MKTAFSSLSISIQLGEEGVSMIYIYMAMT